MSFASGGPQHPLHGKIWQARASAAEMLKHLIALQRTHRLQFAQPGAALVECIGGVLIQEPACADQITRRSLSKHHSQPGSGQGSPPAGLLTRHRSC